MMKGVSLTETIFAADPVTRNAIKEDRSMPGGQNPLQPGAPPIIKSSSLENREEAGPVN
jgi:hypothetical protein